MEGRKTRFLNEKKKKKERKNIICLSKFRLLIFGQITALTFL